MAEWDEEAIKQYLNEVREQYIQDVLAAANEVFQELAQKAIESAVQTELEKGGASYEEIKKKIIANAQAWYDAYPSPPRRYKRRGTLTDAKNIQIKANVSGGVVELSLNHLSDQAEYVMQGFYIHNRSVSKDGFWSVERGGIAFREGCNFLKEIDEEHMSIEPTVSKSESTQLYKQAVRAVL